VFSRCLEEVFRLVRMDIRGVDLHPTKWYELPLLMLYLSSFRGEQCFSLFLR